MPMLYETIAKFSAKGKSAYGTGPKRGGEVYFVRRNIKTGMLSCTCKGCLPVDAKKAEAGPGKSLCRHIDYVKENPVIVLKRIPTYQEAVLMAWGKDMQVKEKWLSENLKEIEI